MKYAIFYSSMTGNTKKLAEALREAFPAEDCVYCGRADSEKAADAETVFVGFWTDKGTCDGPTALLLGNLAGKRVILFGTAGFGGSQEYFDSVLSRVIPNLSQSATYLGGWMCAGQMQPSVLARYEAMKQQNPDDPKIELLIQAYHNAVGHPNSDDCAALAAFAKERI